MVKSNITHIAFKFTLIFAGIGLIFGIIYSFGGLLIDTLVTLELVKSNETPGLSYGTILAFGALIGMPAIGGAVGLVMGLIIGISYHIYLRIKR